MALLPGSCGEATSCQSKRLPVRTWPDTVPHETRTLGWDVLAWTSRHLLQPDGPDAGSVESPPVDLADPDQLRAGIIAARGDADRLDVEWIVSTIYSGHMPRSRSQRMFLNQLVTAEDQLISPEDWDNCAVDDRLEDGDAVTPGFDGGKSDDATCLIAMRVRDRLIVPLGVWERPDGPAGGGWEVDRHAVDGAVRNAMERYDVQAFHADVALWESYVDAWSEDYRDRLVIKASPQSAVGRDMRGGLQVLTLANERLVAAVEDGHVRHQGEAVPLGRTLRRHVLNARRRPNRHGLSFGKPHRESADKVDAYAATLLADLARHRLIESGKARSVERSGAVYFF